MLSYYCAYVVCVGLVDCDNLRKFRISYTTFSIYIYLLQLKHGFVIRKRKRLQFLHI